MNYGRFLRELPSLYDHWGTPEVKPHQWAFEAIRDQWAMTNENVAQLLNFAVQCLEPDEIYLEVGVLQGASLCGALYGNTAKAWAVDNWSDFPPSGEPNREIVLRRLRAIYAESRVTLFEQDYREFFSQSRDVKVGVYFYDGEHQYKGTWDGLELAIPYLAENAIICMDDANWSMVNSATRDWIKAHQDNVQVLFDLTTPTDSKAWWNGILVIEYHRNSIDRSSLAKISSEQYRIA